MVQKVMERIWSVKKFDQKSYCSSYFDGSVNKYGIKYETSFRFGENKGWINEINPHVWF